MKKKDIILASRNWFLNPEFKFYSGICLQKCLTFWYSVKFATITIHSIHDMLFVYDMCVWKSKIQINCNNIDKVFHKLCLRDWKLICCRWIYFSPFIIICVGQWVNCQLYFFCFDKLQYRKILRIVWCWRGVMCALLIYFYVKKLLYNVGKIKSDISAHKM